MLARSPMVQQNTGEVVERSEPGCDESPSRASSIGLHASALYLHGLIDMPPEKINVSGPKVGAGPTRRPRRDRRLAGGRRRS